ncbi:MAG: alpha/beta fold hydrolase [Pseudomonadota bacterium]|nr:alpha/beta fold hydrolase [Pseudomonadota bacterium]
MRFAPLTRRSRTTVLPIPTRSPQDTVSIGQQIAQQMTILTRPYRPTPWLFNAHLQLLFLGLQKKNTQTLHYDRIEQLSMHDGGTTALYWMGAGLPDHTPTLVILHTITATPSSMHPLIQDLHHHTGWRIVLCLRRGHADLKLTTPKISLFGSTSDLHEQLEAIQRYVPQSPLYGLGSSAGSGLLVRYLGETAEQSKFKAAFAYCPGYNIDEAFAKAHPIYSRLMTKKLIEKFIEPHLSQLNQLTSLPQLKTAKTLLDFHDQSYELAGYQSYTDYSAAHNPMRVFKQIQTPLMVLNAEDDPICKIENAEPYVDLIQQMSNVIFVTTTHGSHCAHYEGWHPESWATRLMADFFLTSHQQLHSA